MVPSTTEMQTSSNDPKTEKIVLPIFPKSINGSCFLIQFVMINKIVIIQILQTHSQIDSV